MDMKELAGIPIVELEHGQIWTARHGKRVRFRFRDIPTRAGNRTISFSSPVMSKTEVKALIEALQIAIQE